MEAAPATTPVPGPTIKPMAERFRGYLPVVVDVETGGFDWNRHALLELAAIPIELDAEGRLVPGEVACSHFEPAPGTEIVAVVNFASVEAISSWAWMAK